MERCTMLIRFEAAELVESISELVLVVELDASDVEGLVLIIKNGNHLDIQRGTRVIQLVSEDGSRRT